MKKVDGCFSVSEYNSRSRKNDLDDIERRIEIASKFTLEDHIEILNAVIEGHVGARYINITYKPYTHSLCLNDDDEKKMMKRRMINLLCDLARQYKGDGWEVTTSYSCEPQIMLSNTSNFDKESAAESYTGYPYSRHTCENIADLVSEQWTKNNSQYYDFFVPNVENKTRLIERLCFLDRCIKVEIKGLIISRALLCREEATSGERLPEKLF